MKRWVVFFSFLLFASLCSAGVPLWVPVGHGTGQIEEPLVTTTTVKDSLLSFEIEVPGFLVEQEYTKGGTFSRLAMPGQTFSGERGQAKLPAIRVLIEVPYSADISIQPGKSEVKEYPLSFFGIDTIIVPVQDSILKTEDGLEKWQFVKEDKYYAHDKYMPSVQVKILNEVMMRAHRVIQLEIVPVAYNPIQGKVTVSSRLSFDVQMTGGQMTRTVKALRDSWSNAYEANYANQVINYGFFRNLVTKGDMKTSHWDGLLIISDPDFYSYADVLAQWREKMGYYVEHVDTTTTGTTSTAIKNYIQAAYGSWTSPSLSFVLLVGDVDQIPTIPGQYCSSCASDSDYACLAGSDNIHDIFIGRISVETTGSASEVFDRFMTYAKATFSNDMAWIKKACFASSCDSTYNTYHTHEYCLSTYTQPNGYTGDYYPSSDPGGDLIRCIEDYGGSASSSGADVIHAIDDTDKGRSLVLYSGHCGQTEWSGPNIDASEADAFTCGDRDIIPFMAGHCCLAHSIDYSTRCMGEACIRAAAIGYFGSSNSSYWGEDDYLQRAWFDKLFTDGQFRMGEYTINGLIDMYNNYSSSLLDYYMDMEIFGGDPTMEIYTEIPLALTVDHLSATPVGTSTFAVNVKRSGANLHNARVCLTKTDGGDYIHEFGTTNANGDVTITMNPAPAGVGTLNVTVTYYNSIPYEGTAAVIVPSGPWLVHDSHIINDSAGNDDGIINPGETINMPITLENIGADGATSVTGTLSTTNGNVTVTDNYATYPNIPVSGTGQSNSNHYAYQVSSGAVNGETIPFTLTWSASGGYSDDATFNVSICDLLTISNVAISMITTESAIITWTTNLNSNSTVYYGTSTPPSQQQTSSTQTTSHSITLTGLTDCTTYYFEVSSTSPGCYTETDDNSGSYYDFTTQMSVTMFSDDMESGSSNWTAASPWAISDEDYHSASHAWSDSPGGVYANSIDISLTSIAFDLSSTTEASLTFWQIYDLESGWDYGYLEISTNGSTWTQLASFNGTQSNWTEASYDLSAYVGNSNVQIRFRLDTDGSQAYDGWHIDDVSIGYAMPCVPLAAYDSHIFTDDCPAGGAGDADGILDAGETITFQIDIANMGTGDLTGVWAELTSSTTGVTVTDAQANYNNIPEGTSGTSLAPHFTVYLAESIACGTDLDFSLTIHTNEGDFNGGSFSETTGLVIPGSGTALNVNFDSTGIPATWTIVDGSSDSWTWFEDDSSDPSGCANDDPASPIGGIWAAVDSDCQSVDMDEQLITPVLDLSAATEVTLEFYHYFNRYGSEYADVDVRSTNTGSAWSTVGQWTADTTNPQLESIDITTEAAGADDVQIRWHYYDANYEWYWYVDNIVVSFTAAGSCEMNICTGGCSMTVDVTPNGTTTVCTGNAIMFMATPTGGTSPYSYQWTEDGSDISGATNATLSRNYATAQSHTYNCKVSDAGACVDITDGTASTGTWELTPGAPVIGSVTDLNACTLTGVSIVFTAGSGASSHNLWVDGSQAATGITSPYTYVPGDTSSHSYVVRAINGGCYANSNAVAGTDANNTPGAPVIGSVTDLNACALTGVSIVFTAGSGASSHNLWVDGSQAATGITSPYTYVPGNTSSHSYVVRAINGSCYANSNAVAGTDVNDGVTTVPVITSIVDNDPLVQDGIFVYYSLGSPATSHNLYRDSSLVVTGYVSGVLYNPGDTNSHNYVVQAINGSCYADSTAVAATDEESTIVPPEIMPIGWSGTGTISWTEEATATNGYVLYRGVQANLASLLTSATDFCIRWTGSSSSDTSATGLTETATVGDCYYFLVVGVNGNGNGTAGYATAGERLVNDTGVCP
ncbi:immune inhibitor A [bacterium]|nr:immune inhibitor A [bacterium]